MNRFWQFVQRIYHETLFKVIVAIVVVVIISAFAVYVFEYSANRNEFQSLGDAMWWAIVTITTVGYGDKIPVTIEGKAVGVFIMFSGVVLISLLTATVSTIFVTRVIKENRGLKQVKFRNHTIICGWNYNTEDIIRTFSNHSPTRMDIVLVNELPPERMDSYLREFHNLNIRYIHGDFTKESPLHLANIKVAKSVIVLPDLSTGISQQTDDRTLLATLTIKSLNPKVKVYAHIVNRTNHPHLKRARADEVLVSDQHIGFFLANHILYPGAPQVVDELLDEKHGQYIRRVAIPKDFVNRTYGELFTYLKHEKNWTLIGLTHDIENIQLKDVLSHDYSALDGFIERKFKEAGIDIQERTSVRTVVNPSLTHLIDPKDFAIVIGTLNSNGKG